MGRLATAIIWGQLTFLGLGLAGAAAHEGHGATAPDDAMETVFHNYAAAVAALEALVTQDQAVVSAALASGRPTLLAFLDRRCVPCLRMVGVVAELQQEFAAMVNVVALDTDDKGAEIRALLQRFSVWGGPVFVLIDGNGRQIDRRVGLQPVQSLRTRLHALVSRSPGGRPTAVDSKPEPAGPRIPGRLRPGSQAPRGLADRDEGG